MFRLKRILFPVDFSERCRGAAAYAAALAGRFDAELMLLHVMEPSAHHSTPADLLEVRPEKLSQFLGPDLKQLRVSHAVERGEVARTIVQYACAKQADLIMMAAQGLGIYRRLIIGSNTAKVLHDADCPVWTGVHLENAPPLDYIACKRIICAVDLKPASAAVLDWAHWMSQEYQAELTLVHVTPQMEAGPARYFDHTFEADLQQRAQGALEDLQKVVGSNAAVRVEGGEPAHAVTEVARQVKADLLVIGRKAQEGLLGRLTTHAYSIIRQSPCPVVSV
jgi:nucleotide-binding universal stress UspA family protein